MNYLHYELTLKAHDSVEVTLEGQAANVRLLDDANFLLYRSGKTHRYHGGHAKQSPVIIPAPHAGHWHVVVDLGGYPGTVKASVRVLQEV